MQKVGCNPVVATHPFLIVIPVKNGFVSITRTIESILKLKNASYVHLHIQDGGSIDGTCEIAYEYLTAHPLSTYLGGFSIESGPDNGMYDAICKGFEGCHGDESQWLTWINAGDHLAPDALMTVLAVDYLCSGHSSWITGSIRAELLHHKLVCKPFITNVGLIRKGLADNSCLPYLQQEGTFFRRSAFSRVDTDKFRSLRAAGDYFLWLELACLCPFIVCSAKPLGTWTQHPGQLSERLRYVYLQEIEICRPLWARQQWQEKISGEDHYGVEFAHEKLAYKPIVFS